MSLATNTPLLFTDLNIQADSYNYTCLGMPLVDGGLVMVVQVNGVGLLSSGLVWQKPEIWFDTQSVDGIATGWTAAAGYSGGAAASLVVTAWTESHAFGNEYLFF